MLVVVGVVDVVDVVGVVDVLNMGQCAVQTKYNNSR